MRKFTLSTVFLICAFSAFTQVDISLQQKVVSNDRFDNDRFGSSTSIDSSYAIVGVPYKDYPDFMNPLSASGAAYIFEQDGLGNWSQVNKLVAPVQNAADYFGWDVAIHGDYAVIGAHREDEDENEANTLSDAGAAYIFKRDALGQWLFEQKIVASDRGGGDYFGQSVAIYGDYIVIGANLEDEDASGANFLNNSGSVYIFKRDVLGNWNEVQKITASDRLGSAEFGNDVAIHQDRLVVGCWKQGYDEQNMNLLQWAGAAYIFELNAGIWTEANKIVSSDRNTQDHFGFSVSIHGDFVLCGAYYDDEDENGLNYLAESGSAYLFQRDVVGNWAQQQKIAAPDRESGAGFGGSVSIFGDLLICGASGEDKDENGALTLSNAGAIYSYRLAGSSWQFNDKHVAYDRSVNDGYASDVALSNSNLIVGAGFEDEDANGMNTVSNAGSVYLYGTCYITHNTLDILTCNSYTVPSGDETYFSSGTYSDTIPNAAGCDSILTINLTIGNNTGSETASACDTYTWASNGMTYTTSGAYNDTLTNVSGCDSVVTLNLTINQSSSNPTQFVTSCESYTWSVNNVTYFGSGIYTESFTNQFGCDSTLTLDLTIFNASTSTLSATACDSYSLNGQTYTSSGTYQQVLMNTAGCDSTITLILAVNNSSGSTVSASACDSYTLNGQTYTSSGTYQQVLTNAQGCDSTIQLQLTIYNSSTITLTDVGCDSYTLNGQTYTSSGTYQQTLTNANGCDSIITLNLVIYNSSQSNLTITACESYTLNGQTYVVSGTYQQVITNAFGCDSTITLNLTLNYTSSYTITASACDGYTLNGQTYTSTGIYQQTLTNAVGCDSTIQLQLTILNSTSETLNETACDSYTLNGQTYTSSGTYQQQLTNVNGCDSIITLNLLVSSSSQTNVAEIACESFTLNGQTFTSSGTYQQDLFNTYGCDSTIILNLTILQPDTVFITEQACGSYDWNGQVYTTSGTYQQTFINQNGCDSTVELSLTVTQLEIGASFDGTTLISDQLTGTYQWGDCSGTFFEISGATGQTYVPMENSFYAVIVSDQGCVDTSECIIVEGLGVSDVSIEDVMKIYPNPIGDEIVNVQIGVGYAELKLYTISGQLLSEQLLNMGQNALPFDVRPGTYVFEIVTEDGMHISRKKVIKY